MLAGIPVHQVESIISFVLEIEKLKSITRKVKPLGIEGRYENSAEHSWQITVFALSLAPHVPAQVNIVNVVNMLLVHDIGEIDTGDTMAFVEGGWEERKALELKAVERIFGLLPEPSRGHFLARWKEFETAETPDAKLANALDRAMPVLLNLNNRGQSWRENNISYERVIKRIQPPIQEGFPDLWNYLSHRLELAKSQGYFGA